MSTAWHHESSAHGNDGIQPKVKDCTYDEDTNPACLMLWLTLVSGVVSTHGEDVSGGAPLENFLDNHFNRRKRYLSTKSACLEDPLYIRVVLFIYGTRHCIPFEPSPSSCKACELVALQSIVTSLHSTVSNNLLNAHAQVHHSAFWHSLLLLWHSLFS